MTDREVMKMALAKLEHLWEIGIDAEYKVELKPEIRVLRQALAQPEQEPVVWISEPMVAAVRRANPDWYGKWNAELTCTQMFPHQIPLYTAPPSKPWVSLTDEEKNKLWKDVIGWGDPSHDEEDLMKAIEAALRSKNDPTSN